MLNWFTVPSNYGPFMEWVFASFGLAAELDAQGRGAR
jgi:hypothetical protein